MTNDATPKHIAFIMDGNGRWAKKRLLPRQAGHREGAKTFRKVTDYCKDAGVNCATFYAFSTENWQRSPDEVNALMKLFGEYLDEIERDDRKDARLIFLGDISSLPGDLPRRAADSMRRTARYHESCGFTLAVAVNYGARQEIARAAEQFRHSSDPAASLEQFLYTAQNGLPPLDLIIRTGGEHRLSNFMLWQAAYAELLFLDTLWPDFSERDFSAALLDFSNRQRRFGK